MSIHADSATAPSWLRPLAAWSLCLALGGLGCTSGEPPKDELPPPPADALRVALGPYALNPGQETTVCVTGYLPNTFPLDVVRIETRQLYSHHIILYRESEGVPDSPAPVSCPPLDILSTSRAPLFIGETPTAAMDLPPGVAYRLGSRTPYRIEGHFLNASPNPQQALAEIFLTPAPSGSTMQEADMIFISATTQLNKIYDGGSKGGLPPMRDQTIDPAFWALPSDMQDSKFFALTSHQHRLGTHFTISKSADAGAAGSLLYENSDWEHPLFKLYPQDAPLTFKPGEGFRWVCSYRNTTASYINFGQSAEKNEMCIIWAYYYPSQGFRVQFL
jgi:hypothetical protein